MTIPSWKTELKQVAPNAYAYIQGGGPGLSNAGIANAGLIVGDEFAMVVDTTQGPIPAEAFLAEIKKVTAKPVRYVVNTHWHGDHTYGNQYFVPAQFIAHEKCRAHMLAQTPVGTTWKAEPGVAEGGEPRVNVVPDTTIPASVMTFYFGATKVEVHAVDWAHTEGDIMVFLPEQKVLFAADACFFYVAPTFFSGTSAGTLRALDWIDTLDVNSVVPGHGPVGTKKEAGLTRRYIETLRDAAKMRFDAGLGVAEAAATIDMGEFREWPEAQDRQLRNTLRLYHEFQGKPYEAISLADSNAVMKDYVEKLKR